MISPLPTDGFALTTSVKPALLEIAIVGTVGTNSADTNPKSFRLFIFITIIRFSESTV